MIILCAPVVRRFQQEVNEENLLSKVKVTVAWSFPDQEPLWWGDGGIIDENMNDLHLKQRWRRLCFTVKYKTVLLPHWCAARWGTASPLCKSPQDSCCSSIFGVRRWFGSCWMLHSMREALHRRKGWATCDGLQWWCCCHLWAWVKQTQNANYKSNSNTFLWLVCFQKEHRRVRKVINEVNDKKNNRKTINENRNNKVSHTYRACADRLHTQGGHSGPWGRRPSYWCLKVNFLHPFLLPPILWGPCSESPPTLTPALSWGLWCRGTGQDPNRPEKKTEREGKLLIIHSLFPAYTPGTCSMWSSDLLTVGLRWSFN